MLPNSKSVFSMWRLLSPVYFQTGLRRNHQRLSYSSPSLSEETTKKVEQQIESSSSAAAADIITVTDRCVERLKKVADQNECLRVMVDSGGCSGFEYKFELVKCDKLEKEDRVFEKNGAKVIIDELSVDYLRGATIDYQEELIKSSFRIVNNPKAAKGCSCGASFSLKS